MSIPDRRETRLLGKYGVASCKGIFSICVRISSSLTLYRNFRYLLISNLFFFSGVWTQTIVLGWLIFDMTGSEFSVAVFTAARMAPTMLGPLSGVISDKFDRIRLLSAASTWGFITLSIIAGLVSADAISYWGLVIAGFCIGMAQSPSQPARLTMVYDFVGRQSLSNANALNSIVTNMSQIIGPAVGGAAIATFGTGVALWVAALWYLASLVALWPLRNIRTAKVAHRGETLTNLMSIGIRSVFSHRLTSSVLLITFAANILLWPIYQAFMPVFAKVSLGLGAEGLGWMVTCSGLGGLLGSLTIAALGDFKHKGALFVIGTATWGALWAAFALSHSVPLSFALIGGIGFASSPFVVLQTTLLLMMTEPRIQGRVLGLQELAIGIMPLATIGLGAAAELVGVTGVALVNGLLLVVFLVVLAAKVPELLRYCGSRS